MGGACNVCGGEERCIQGFGRQTLGKEHLGDPDVDGRIILRWNLEVECRGTVGSSWLRIRTSSWNLCIW